MADKLNGKTKNTGNETSPLIYIGLAVIILWVGISAWAGFTQNLKCDITPSTCDTPGLVYYSILVAPFLIGSAILSIGATDRLKEYVSRIALIIVSTLVLSAVGYCAMGIFTLLIHGIK